MAAGAIEDGLVICPWHAWCFKLADGEWTDNPNIKVDTFEVLVDGDQIKVGVKEVDTESGDDSEAEKDEGTTGEATS